MIHTQPSNFAKQPLYGRQMKAECTDFCCRQEEGADVVHYSMSDGTLQKTAVDSFVNEYGDQAVSLDANTNHWLIVHLTPEVSTPNESSAAGENQEETDEAASQSLEGKVDEDTSETTSQDVAKADPTKPSKPSEKSSSESATKPTKPTTKAPETTKRASTKPAQTTKAPETAATVAPTAATTCTPYYFSGSNYHTNTDSNNDYCRSNNCTDYHCAHP